MKQSLKRKALLHKCVYSIVVLKIPTPRKNQEMKNQKKHQRLIVVSLLPIISHHPFAHCTCYNFKNKRNTPITVKGSVFRRTLQWNHLFSQSWTGSKAWSPLAIITCWTVVSLHNTAYLSLTLHLHIKINHKPILELNYREKEICLSSARTYIHAHEAPRLKLCHKPIRAHSTQLRLLGFSCLIHRCHSSQSSPYPNSNG